MFEFSDVINHNVYMGKSSQQEGKIRESIVNGIFYANDPDVLTHDVENLLNSQKNPEYDAMGILTPHAGYDYAGKIMAAAFRAAAKRVVKNVVILAPIHGSRTRGIYFPESKYFLTPLGAIPVNLDLIEDILNCGTGLHQGDIPHLEEHCIEVQLPFIRYLFPQAQIIPILMGESTLRMVKLLRNSLQLTLGDKIKNTLFIITANLTAFISKKKADEEADLFIEKIQSNNWEELMELKTTNQISSCGVACLASFLSFNGFNFQTEVLKRGTSENVNHNSKEIVHYAGISFRI